MKNTKKAFLHSISNCLQSVGLFFIVISLLELAGVSQYNITNFGYIICALISFSLTLVTRVLLDVIEEDKERWWK